MSLQDLSFDPYLLAKLFPQPIIPEAAPAAFLVTPASLKYLGKNKKQILIIIQNEKEAFCSESSFTLLSNILRACRLQAAEDVAIFNCAHYPSISWEMLNDFFKPTITFFFGVENKNVFPADLIKYRLEKFQHIQLLAADSLLTLENDKSLKEKLWKILQSLFLPK